MASGTGIAPITTGLENLLGVNTTAGTQQLQQAIQALQSVGVPTAQQLDLSTLQQYVSAGVLTPAQYQAIQANPDTYSQMIQQTQNNTGTNAETQALQELGGIVNAGGSTAINQANLLNNLNQVNQQQQAARSANLENAQERGVAGGGLEFLNNMVSNQQGAQNANSNAVNAAANNAQLALQAMTQQGQLGGQLQGQSNQMSQAQAQAAQQIAEYNSQLQSSANQYNTQTANQAQAANLQNAQNIANANTQNKNYVTQYNAQVPETVFANQNQLANEEAQQYGKQADLAEQQAANQNNFTGSLIGAGATLGGDYLMGSTLGGGGASGGAGASGSWGPSGSQGASAYGNDVTSPGYQQNNQILGQQTLNYADGGDVKSYPDEYVAYQSAPYRSGSSANITPEAPSKNESFLQKILDNINLQGTNPRALLGIPGGPGIVLGSGSDNSNNYAKGGDVMPSGKCYAKGGEAHSHEVCMKIGGPVPGKAKVAGDSKKNDTIPAKLSPHEIVLPRSVSLAPNAPQKAAQFVAGVKANGGNPPSQTNAMPKPLNFSDVLKQLEAQGIELKLGAR